MEFYNYKLVLSSYPDYKFGRALSLFSGNGEITKFLAKVCKHVTAIDIEFDCEAFFSGIQNINFIPYDALRLVEEHSGNKFYDIIDIHTPVSWEGLRKDRFEFYSFFPRIIPMCKKLLVFSMIDDIASDEFFKYLKRRYIFNGQDATEEAIKRLLKEREKFFGSTNITNWTISRTLNRLAEDYNRKFEFLSRERFGIFDRVYLEISKIDG